MAKVFKTSELSSCLLNPYERITLEAPVEVVDEPDTAEMREAILAEARDEAAQKVREAYAEGMRRGIEAGKARFDEMVNKAASALNAAASAMTAARTEFLAGLEPQVVGLACEIAAAILQRETEIDRSLIVQTAKRALTALVDRERVVLRVNPADLAGLRMQKVTILDEFSGIAKLEIVGDAEIEPGGCVADSERMHADARFTAQWGRIVLNLAEAVVAATAAASPALPKQSPRDDAEIDDSEYAAGHGQTAVDLADEFELDAANELEAAAFGELTAAYEDESVVVGEEDAASTDETEASWES